MLAIPRNVCALRNHPWQHGSGKLVKSRMHCKFRWNFCFHRSLYNDLSQSDTWRGTSGRKENTNPAEPDSTVLRWKSFQISNLKDFILDCWKLFSTSKIPPQIPKFQLLHFLDFLSQHRNAAFADLFSTSSLHFRNDFLKALGTTIYPRRLLPCFGNLQSFQVGCCMKNENVTLSWSVFWTSTFIELD